METAPESTVQPPDPTRGWGGKRPGAGRRPRDLDKWVAARGLKPATAAEILDRADERRIWRRLLNSEDETIVLRAVTYLTDRRDGRASQQINITQNNIQLTAEETERARAVVRELRRQPPLALPAADTSVRF